MPCYLPVIQYADHHPLREQMYRAFVTRASESGKPEWDNTPLIARILEKRAEVAKLLGYDTFAGVSLATKMAQSPSEVVAFLEDLAARAKPFAQRDMAEIVEFARERARTVARGAGLGRGLGEREAAPEALRVLRQRGKALFSGRRGARGPVRA